mgnify:CR=1 FL=1
MILACRQLHKAYGIDVILEKITFHIEEREKAAIVGVNGAGKTTLFKVLTSEISADGGEFYLKKDASLGYLAQNIQIDSDRTIYEEMLSVFEKIIQTETNLRELENEMGNLSGQALAEKMEDYATLQHYFEQNDGYSYQSRLRGVLKGLGFADNDFNRPMNQLSGGQKTRVHLAKLLLSKPDILLLDEPTNYLDIQSVRWLENFLLDFPNTVIVVSHDRHFLNKVCTHICDIDFGKIQMYVGNYDFWYEYTQMAARQQKDINKKNEQKIKELQAFIQRFSANASKHKQATSRKKLLDNLQMENFTPSSRRYPYIAWKPDRDIGNDLLTVTNLSKTVNGRKVLNNISFVLTPGDKVAFVGTDELARTTLFQILMGEMEPDEGSFKWGVTTSRSYFPKDNGKYFDNCEYNLIDWLRQFSQSQYESDIRGWLGRMLFSGEEALKPARVLSGGEKVRCMLARTMLSGANVLILDEPTNHLDLESITALNKGMIEFTGSMLFATQDHECIQTVANRIMEILPGGLVDRRESYDDYIESEIAAQQRAALMQA